MKKILKNKKGFSLLEILVSIAVILIGILPIMNLFAGTLNEEIANRKRLTAIYLAQEGSEIVRQLRDLNIKDGIAWDDNSRIITGSDQAIVSQNCDSPSNGFSLQVISTNINDLVYMKNNAYMQCNSGIPIDGVNTGFIRSVRIEKKDYDEINEPEDDDYMRIVVTVSHSGTVLYTLKTYLNKWQ